MHISRIVVLVFSLTLSYFNITEPEINPEIFTEILHVCDTTVSDHNAYYYYFHAEKIELIS